MVKGKVIASDLDGTLFYPKRPTRLLAKDNKEFLQRFIGDGGRFLIVSSRTNYMSNKVMKALGCQVDCIGCNGAYVYVNGKMVYEKCFDKEYLREILDFVRENFKPTMVFVTSRDRNLVLNRTGVTRFTNFAYFCYNLVQGVFKDPFIRSDHIFFQELNKGHVYKVMCMIGITGKKKKKAMEANRILREKFPEAEFSWIGEFIEITPKGVSKGNGLSFYLDYCGISKDNMLVVGDNGNDISMFQTFYDNSYVMEHSDEHIKKHAKYVIERFSDLEGTLYPSEDNDNSRKEEKHE